MDGFMFKGLGSMLMVGFVSFILLIILLVYFGVRKFVFPVKKKIESKTLIVPKIKLHTDGKKIDTIYVYKENK